MLNCQTSRGEQLKIIRDEVWNLKTSSLYAERIKNKAFAVIGEGDHYAKIMFVGEAPGKNEAETGRPFCGTSGKVLDELFKSVDIKRQSVYITNIVKDRPPGNRDPLPEEIAIYAPFFDRQVAIIQPLLIATLGRFSMDYVMRKFGLAAQIEPISRIHGQVFRAMTEYGEIKIFPLYHPAVAVYDRTKFKILAADFCRLYQEIT